MDNTTSLNEMLGLDSLPILVRKDGTIEEDIRDQNVPDAGSYGADFEDEAKAGINGWIAVDGFSGQHGYSGPVMHESEYIGGGLEEHIRKTPGYYAVEAVYDEDDSNGHAHGWILLHKPLDK